jgi:hypothetical protein
MAGKMSHKLRRCFLALSNLGMDTMAHIRSTTLGLPPERSAPIHSKYQTIVHDSPITSLVTSLHAEAPDLSTITAQ